MNSLKAVDTHCHLESDEFRIDLPEVIDRASALGVSMISSGINPVDWPKCLRISGQYPNVYAAVGLDPAMYSDQQAALRCIREASSRIVAVGEIGLDHYLVREHTMRLQQEETFRAMIHIASELRLPIQVHSRSAGRRALEVVRDCEATRVQMHAFDGKASLARDASRDLGYYFSIPTSVVRSPQKRKLVTAVDYEHLLVETDSPVLGADRTMRNEPSNVCLVIGEIAGILRREKDEVRTTILENTRRLYPTIGTKQQS